ncbi:tryptophan synthase subunit alpha [Dactylosporangium sp. CA-052675]|uniref:tryptophan synthase subunit alpha n=1 Tax=Dactylosporangium sp. CA-052675 TaxID=3239927 RepID=UPI003D937B4B
MPDEFFPGRRHGRPGVALFLNAGDPPLDVLGDVVHMLDEAGVDCLELAVPFPDSVTDGPVVRRSARRALDTGVDVRAVLAFIAEHRPSLRRLRIALLADWSHSVKPYPLSTVVGEVAAAGADGLLLHALPPRLAEPYRAAAATAALPIVTTCYASGSAASAAAAAEHASAYLYLVAHYGRSGTPPAAGFADLSGTVARLRAMTTAPIAVGFGVRTGADVSAVHDCGADAAIVGTAGVARIERALADNEDVVVALHDFVRSIQPAPADQAPRPSGGRNDHP